MNESNIKNLLKKPASGGIPPIENKISENVIKKTLFFNPEDVQLARYVGNRETEITAKINIENSNKVNPE